ncbi:STK31 kinase, partial [Centropus unirufus]|nr:STK31 kinase [Centropus unirufus]
NVSRCNELLELSCVLAEACPRANAVLGRPDFGKIYGGCFSEDRCWYRCVVQQCRVLYIDYGNSEVLNRSDIVEIPPNLQYPGVAQKYRLWGLQATTCQSLSVFDQGRKLLSSLLFEKEIKLHHKATCRDGTIIVQAKYENIDIGEEVAKAGFAEKAMSPGNTKGLEERKGDVVQNQHWKIKMSLPLWLGKSGYVYYIVPKRSCDKVAASARDQDATGNAVFAPKEKVLLSTSEPDTSLAQIKPDQNLTELLRRENVDLLQKQEELELKVQKLRRELKVWRKKEASRKAAKNFEETLRTYVGVKMRSLAALVKALKEDRQTNQSSHFGEQLPEAIEVVGEGCLTVPCSLEKLQKTWTEYDLAQERIRLCRNVDERDELIAQRDEVRQNLCSVAEELILEVDQLPLSERSRKLQELSAALEMVHSEDSTADDAKEVFQQFFKGKSIKTKKLIGIRNQTDSALQTLTEWFGGAVKCFDLMSEVSSDLEEMADNVDEILKKAELAISEELCADFSECDKAVKGIIASAYNKLMHNIRQEQRMIAAIQNRYLACVEFKTQAEEWRNRRPDINNLLSIKKSVKSLKAQLRWKLVAKSNLEESDDYSEFEMTGIKEEITDLRNRFLQEIYKEQEEYGNLTYLVQKWFPELPFLYPEAGLLSYMNSGGLLTQSLERDLLDTEPMKGLSTKRPLVCSEIWGQKILLKGYSVDVSSEAKVIERVAKYHRVWNQQKEKSGLLQLLFLLSCKSDPLLYLMVPYYPGASLGDLQADAPLTLEETLKVMKGVAQGLQTLHGANIVHGSLHGNNIFAVNRKQGIVGDFDFTKSEEERATASSMAVSTLSLVSPELKKGQPASPASDMYAYGCLLLWLCVPNQEYGIKEDGSPEVDGAVTDDKVKSLLLKLFCCTRLTAEQVLKDDCFLTVDALPVSPQSDEEHKSWEEHDSEKTGEK